MVKLREFDASRYLDTEESVAAYLAEALETNDAEFISEAISTVARARGMTQLAKTSGVSREQLYRSFGRGANPTLKTVLRVLEAMNVTLSATPATAKGAARGKAAATGKTPAKKASAKKAVASKKSSAKKSAAA
ncbi:MAG: addiction module antidote protein [Halieaceae bacterium]|jgi:probable addiction module antidote protein|nr:addiction module antidote protein [Halieaceae bacterium]